MRGVLGTSIIVEAYFPRFTIFCTAHGLRERRRDETINQQPTHGRVGHQFCILHFAFSLVGNLDCPDMLRRLLWPIKKHFMSSGMGHNRRSVETESQKGAERLKEEAHQNSTPGRRGREDHRLVTGFHGSALL